MAPASKTPAQDSYPGVRGAPPPGSPGGPLVVLASADKGRPGAGRAPTLSPPLASAAGGATVRLLASRGGGAATEVGFGVLVDGRGYVLTPDRLVGDSRGLQVRLADGRQLPVQRVWRDPLAGVAVLKIEGGGFPAIAMGDSGDLRVGDAATIVGGAAAAYPATSQAKIRATGSATGGSLAIDVPVNDDRIGSPLIDQSGRVVALATSGEASPSGSAIPIDRAKPMLRQAMATSTPRAPAPAAAPAVFGSR